jgi:predicted DNA-binding transcriptional regulator AlpA
MATKHSATLKDLGLEPLVGSDVVMKATGWKSLTTLMDAINAGNFPKPDRVDGRLRRWFPSTIRRWQLEQQETAA